MLFGDAVQRFRPARNHVVKASNGFSHGMHGAAKSSLEISPKKFFALPKWRDTLVKIGYLQTGEGSRRGQFQLIYRPVFLFTPDPCGFVSSAPEAHCGAAGGTQPANYKAAHPYRGG
jgi:hypothetical protein